MRFPPLAAAALALAACQPSANDEPVEAEAPEIEPTPAPAPTATADATRATSTATPDCTKLRPAALTEEAQRGVKGARNVLLEWGRALENGRFDRAWCQFAEDGAASGMGYAEYAAFWSRYDSLTVAMPDGTMEGAAGTSYYTAPTMITAERASGDPAVFTGDVVLRRVNDVPGASEEQLLWQIRSADFTRKGG